MVFSFHVLLDMPKQTDLNVGHALVDYVDTFRHRHVQSMDSWRMRIYDDSGALLGDWGLEVDPLAQFQTMSSQPPPALLND